MTIDKLISNTKALNFDTIIGDVLHDNSQSLVLSQQQQMLRGETAEAGKKIGKYKNKSYRKKKFEMNVLAGYGNVDLRLTGIFQKSIKLYFFSKSFFFTSSDSKTKKLTGKYGEDIFGLNPKSRKPVIKDTVAPNATEVIKNKILSP